MRIIAYCLMTNHVHVIAIPDSSEDLLLGFSRTSQLYSQYFHRKHHEVDHLWKHRFHSVILAHDHYLNALAYVERNPVCAGLCQFAWEFPWSSAAAHVTGHDAFDLLDNTIWANMNIGASWSGVLMRESDSVFRMALYQAQNTGLPLGSKEFLQRLSREYGMTFIKRRVGRPKMK